MDLIAITGELPAGGLARAVVVTVAHDGAERRLWLEVGRHPSGGWHARAPGAAWGLRCHSARTALLLEAAEYVQDLVPAPPALAAPLAAPVLAAA